MNKNIYFYTNLLAWTLVLLIAANYVLGWTTPTQDPPGGNIVLSQGALPSGSAGYVQFASSSTAFGGDAALFWDNTNKRLGIGTTTPGAKLEVEGSLNITGSSSYLRLPNLTTTQRDALSPTPGIIIYNTTNNRFEYYIANTWGTVALTGTNGQSCTTASDCVSGYCVDGYCCNTACDGGSCDACNIAGSLGTCTLQPSTYVCRASADACDPAEYCTGSSAACPADSYQPSTYVCRASAYACDPAEYCTGSSTACPADDTGPVPSSVTFTYKGASVTYGIVIHNNKCWLDRNLGASQVATAYNDSAAVGDLFQWGRLDDGHQTRTSGTTTTLSDTDNPGHSNFIITSASPYDWRSSLNNDLWQGVSGINNPCPSDLKVPTAGEWDDERASWSTQDEKGAFASPLKLTTAGQRGQDGTVSDLIVGNYASSDIDGSNIYNLLFGYGNTPTAYYSNLRGRGLSVRCLYP